MEKRNALKIGMQHTAFFVWAPIQAVILCLLDTPHDQGKRCSQGPNTQKMPGKMPMELKWNYYAESIKFTLN